tara:strand:+ start:342 stop:1460 length:1119 start_codon:yes stop_codon:yes gene_type:complete
MFNNNEIAQPLMGVWTRFQLANVSIEDPLDINTLAGGASAADANSVGQEFVPEVWGQAILDKFQQKTMMLGLANDLSSEAVGADKVHLPHIGVTPLSSVSAGTAIDSDVTSNSAGGGSDRMITTETILEISEHKVTSLFIPDALKAQSSYNLFNMYSDQLAYAIARGVDNYLMYKVVDNLTTAHGSTSGATQDTVDMLEVGDALASSNIDDIFKAVILETGSAEGWTMVLSPTLYASLAALDSGAGFVRGSSAPLGAGFAQTGVAGNILGMNVIVSQSPYLDVASVSADADKGITAWTGFDTDGTDNDDILRGFCIHESALYYAASQAPRVQQSYQHRYLSDLVTVDAIYGCAVRNSAVAGDRRIIGLSKNV